MNNAKQEIHPTFDQVVITGQVMRSGRVTLCKLDVMLEHQPRVQHALGLAICHPKDRYDIRTGTNLAVGRALKELTDVQLEDAEDRIVFADRHPEGTAILDLLEQRFLGGKPPPGGREKAMPPFSFPARKV